MPKNEALSQLADMLLTVLERTRTQDKPNFISALPLSKVFFMELEHSSHSPQTTDIELIVIINCSVV